MLSIRLFFFFVAAYFLKNSLSNSIIVELWRFVYIMAHLNILSIFIGIITLILKGNVDQSKNSENFYS